MSPPPPLPELPVVRCCRCGARMTFVWGQWVIAMPAPAPVLCLPGGAHRSEHGPWVRVDGTG